MDDRIPTPPAAEDALAALRTRITEAVSRAGVYPVARRTVELLLEAAVAPSPEPPGYRVLDRAGRARSDPEGDRPLGLDDLIAEARARHPALFRPPEPEPVPVVAAEPDATADIKAATARFVDAQSVRARSLIARSAGRGRALAAAASQAWTRWRPRPAPTPPEATAPAGPVAATSAGGFGTRLRGIAGDTALQARGRAVDMAARLRDVTHNRTILRDAVDRRAFALGVGALILVGIAVVLTGRNGEGEPPAVQNEAQVPPAAPGNPGTGAPVQTANPAPAEEPQRPVRPDEISGATEVIDTATLRVGGKLVRLFGVEWVRGGQADELTRYLAGRSVTCQPVAGSEARLCNVDGRDLSEVVLFNGGGRASPEATPDLVAAEDHARSERLGVWAR